MLMMCLTTSLGKSLHAPVQEMGCFAQTLTGFCWFPSPHPPQDSGSFSLHSCQRDSSCMHRRRRKRLFLCALSRRRRPMFMGCLSAQTHSTKLLKLSSVRCAEQQVFLSTKDFSFFQAFERENSEGGIACASSDL